MKVKHFNYLGILWLKFAKYSAVYINPNIYNTGNVVICKTIVKIQTGRFSNILTVKKKEPKSHKKTKQTCVSHKHMYSKMTYCHHYPAFRLNSNLSKI